MDGFNYDEDKPHAFIQYKGTDICMDFFCDCGAHCHFDGYFAYAVKCPHCEAVWQMPFNLFPRKITAADDAFSRAKVLEPDEDYSNEVTDPADGVRCNIS